MNFFSQPVVLDTEFGVQQEMTAWFDKEKLGQLESVNIELDSQRLRFFQANRFRFKFSLGLVGLLGKRFAEANLFYIIKDCLCVQGQSGYIG